MAAYIVTIRVPDGTTEEEARQLMATKVLGHCQTLDRRLVSDDTVVRIVDPADEAVFRAERDETIDSAWMRRAMQWAREQAGLLEEGFSEAVTEFVDMAFDETATSNRT